MPRSGATLLEQILASHSQVEGALEYVRLMKHWDEVLPGRVPIYSDVLDYCRNYESHLAEVREILAPVLEGHSQK